MVTKKRVSALLDGDLDVISRDLNVSSLISTGFATLGNSASTVRQVAGIDQDLSVLGEGCVESDAEAHRT